MSSYYQYALQKSFNDGKQRQQAKRRSPRLSNRSTISEQNREKHDQEDKENQINKTKKTNEFSKLSRQMLADKLTEYLYKDEQTVKNMEAARQTFAELLEEHNKMKKEYIDNTKELKNHLYTLECAKFKLEEENQSLSEKLDKVQSLSEKVKKLESENDALKNTIEKMKVDHGRFLEMNQTESPIDSKTTFLGNIEKLEHCTVSTPIGNVIRPIQDNSQCVNVSCQIESESENNTKGVKRKQAEEYESLLLNLQSVLDLYSLLTGISLCTDMKRNNKMKKRRMTEHNEEDEEEPQHYLFSLQQFGNDLSGLPFELTFDLKKQTIEFLTNKSEPYKNVPSCLKTSLSYDADYAYHFLKNILNETLKSSYNPTTLE